MGSLIDTGSRGCYIESKASAVKSIRLALAEELAATNTYEDLAESVRQAAFPSVNPDGTRAVVPPTRFSAEQAEKIAKALDEIRDDELQHTGKLLALIALLDDNSAAQLSAGGRGA